MESRLLENGEGCFRGVSRTCRERAEGRWKDGEEEVAGMETWKGVSGVPPGLVILRLESWQMKC